MSKYEYTMHKDVDLKKEQQKTLQAPALETHVLLKVMIAIIDFFYGKKRTLLKFRTLEILARYPYWAWENGSYHRITRTYTRMRPKTKKEIEQSLRHIHLGREAQDNEQWHLMLIEDVMRQKSIKANWWKTCFIPTLLACCYFGLTRCMYYVRPKWSFSLNARFESHAEHQYMLMVQEHPEWEEEPIESEYFEYYPQQKSLADLFRRIGLDERDHKNTSLEEYECLTGTLKKT